MDYPVVIRPLTEDEGGGYLAIYPDLPGCMSDGETPEEALKNGRAALEEWMETAKAREGFAIPEPGARARYAQRERDALVEAVSAIAKKTDDLDGEIEDLRIRVEEIEEMMEHSLAWSRFERLTVGVSAAVHSPPRKLLSHR